MKNKNKFILYFIFIVFPITSSLADEIVTLDTRPGVTQSFQLLEPEGKPEGIVIMFPGHEGVVRFKGTDSGTVIKTERGGLTSSTDARTTYLNNGMVVALVAPPSDMQSGMDTRFRSSKKHLTDISAVIDYINDRYNQFPYLHGHCRSTFSPASIATKLNNQGISGLILSSPRSQGRHGAVMDFEKDVIKVPVLLVQHEDDPCKGTPYSNLDDVIQFYESSSQKVDVITVSGGDTTQSGPSSCQNGAHSFRGLRKETTSEITNWIRKKDFKTRISD